MKTLKSFVHLMQCLLLTVMTCTLSAQAQTSTKAVPDDPKVPYFITIESTAGGTFKGVYVGEKKEITLAESVDLPHGVVITLMVTPDEGYTLKRLTTRQTTTDTETDLILTVVTHGTEIKPEGCTFTYKLESNVILKTYFEKTVKPEESPLPKPEGESTDFIIKGENEYSTGEGGNKGSFNGTIGNGETSSTYSNLTFKPSDDPLSSQLPAVFTVNNVTIKQILEVANDANINLNLNGAISLGNLVNNGTLIISSGNNTVTLIETEITNNGIFTDETGLISEVKGNADLAVQQIGDKEVVENSSITLTASASSQNADSPTFIWEKKIDNGWEIVKVPEVEIKSSILRTSSLVFKNELKVSLGQNTTYRCLIKIVKENISSTLTVYSKVSVKTEETLPPTPPVTVNYSVALPAVMGVITSPASGKYSIEEWKNFSFTLSLQEGYKNSTPVVKANGQIIEPNNNKYIIKNITEDITIEISDITLDTPTSNVDITDTDYKIKIIGQTLYIDVPAPTQIQIVSINGKTISSKKVNRTKQLHLSPDIYIIIYENGKREKFIIRK